MKVLPHLGQRSGRSPTNCFAAAFRERSGSRGMTRAPPFFWVAFMPFFIRDTKPVSYPRSREGASPRSGILASRPRRSSPPRPRLGKDLEGGRQLARQFQEKVGMASPARCLVRAHAHQVDVGRPCFLDDPTQGGHRLGARADVPQIARTVIDALKRRGMKAGRIQVFPFQRGFLALKVRKEVRRWGKFLEASSSRPHHVDASRPLRCWSESRRPSEPHRAILRQRPGKPGLASASINRWRWRPSADPRGACRRGAPAPRRPRRAERPRGAESPSSSVPSGFRPSVRAPS
jgi:hypothetical protein